MSFSRKGPNSDIYMFLHVQGFFECCMCTLPAHRGSGTSFKKVDDAIAHIEQHKAAGHKADYEHIIKRIKDAGDQDGK